MESYFTSTKILAINLHRMEICVRTGDFELLAFPIKTVMLSEVTFELLFSILQTF